MVTDIDNLIERLRTLPPNHDCLRAADALERLQAWKAEAMAVLGEWEAVWEAAGQPGHLGQSKALATRELIDAYRKATGGLPPELVAKYLNWAAQRAVEIHTRYHFVVGLAPADLQALRTTTFEKPT